MFDHVRDMKSIVDMIGFFGPILLFFTTCIRLFYTPRYLWTYLLVFSTSAGLNHRLKDWIREKRPDGGVSIIGEDYTNHHHYGMPSSHAQSVFSTLTYSFLALRSVGWLLFDLSIAALTLIQRFSYRQHSLKQLFVGSVIGAGFATLMYGILQFWVFHNLAWDPMQYFRSRSSGQA